MAEWIAFNPVVMASGQEPRRSRRSFVAAASGLCLLGATVAVVGMGGTVNTTPTVLFGPWNPMSVHVAHPELSMHQSKSMYSMWQQSKWARLFQARKHDGKAAALEERSFADADGFHTALAAARSRAPVRYPTELASTRASELQHNAPRYVRQLELAAKATPTRLQALAAKPKARTQSLDYMESKPRSDERHPGDLDVYQTYEYYPKPEGTGFTDYDGHRLWSEMQKDYRAQHPSASTYPAVPVVFKEDSEGGHPISNPLSQPVEDIYQGMGYEDNLQPPFGMGTMPEGGAKEKQSGGTMQLSPKQGFERMKSQQERQAPAGDSGDSYSYRNPDWHARYVPQMNSDHKTFLATPSVAQPEFYSGNTPQQQNVQREHSDGVQRQEGVQRERSEGRGAHSDRQERRNGHEERELVEERRDLRDKQELILKEQKKLESELNAQKEKHAAKTKPVSPAQALLVWERAHSVDDRRAYAGIASGSQAEHKARHQAEQLAMAVQELRSKQRDELEAKEQQMMSVRLHKSAARSAESTHEQNEELSTLKATIMSMSHRQSKFTAKTDDLKNEVHMLVDLERSQMNSFQGRVHGDEKIAASLRADRDKERSQAAHNTKLEERIAHLEKQEKVKQSEAKALDTTRLQVLALEHRHKSTTHKALMAENARLNAQMRLAMKAQQVEAARDGAHLKQPAETVTALTSQTSQPVFSQAPMPVKIPSAVLQQADSMVKHKVTTELARRYESEIDSDTNFIFSGPKGDESKDSDEGSSEVNASQLFSTAGATRTQQLSHQAPAQVAETHGFSDLHQMEKQVLTQLIQANQHRAQVAKNKADVAKKAAAQKLVLKKKWYQEEVAKENKEKAQKLADKALEKAKATAVADAAYAKAHKPVAKLTVRQRALAFVHAFDDTQSAILEDRQIAQSANELGQSANEQGATLADKRTPGSL
mmetsp:Transcript_43297/g.69607  ORF Transcript_43297/g.69607 Transcript_43297/m.69607 type:complete len:938 (-) Transcript_43297:438-3251(-)